jgi:hypothetical protein
VPINTASTPASGRIDVTTIRATCATCGDVEVDGSCVQVHVCDSTAAAAYSFVCPVCGLIVNKRANDRVVDALIGAGVRVAHWSLPPELDEPKLGPPITHDDLLAFHLALQGGRWREELALFGRGS